MLPCDRISQIESVSLCTYQVGRVNSQLSGRAEHSALAIRQDLTNSGLVHNGQLVHMARIVHTYLTWVESEREDNPILSRSVNLEIE